jgi:CxxC motif-containing protein
MKRYTCITCPMSCDLDVTEVEPGKLEISGNQCDRGRVYAENEYRAPMRVITTTVRIEGARVPLLPVIGTAPVPKKLLRGCLSALYSVSVASPIHMGDVVARDILGTGVDVVAARSL